MKLIKDKLLKLTSSMIAYDYGHKWLVYTDMWSIDTLEVSSLDDLPIEINEGWYLYNFHPELVSNN